MNYCNMKNILFLTIFLFLTFSLPPCLCIHAQESTKEEINSLILAIERRLNDTKNDGAAKYALDDLSKIEEYINHAKKSLSEGKNDQAFYEISIGKSYFKIIEAKKELFLAIQDYEDMKKRLK